MSSHHHPDDEDELDRDMHTHLESAVPHKHNQQHYSTMERMEGGYAEESATSLPSHQNDPSEAFTTASSQEGYALAWKNISMTATPSKAKVEGRSILNNVWGRCPGGKVTCIMGPSGSGKTSLLNVLAGRMSNKTTQGVTIETKNNILWNGYLVDPASMYFRKTIAFVAQDDTLLDTGEFEMAGGSVQTGISSTFVDPIFRFTYSDASGSHLLFRQASIAKDND